MKQFLGGIGLALALGSVPAYAQSAPPSPACTDQHSSPDYVPGIDVHGHAVAPADLPSTSNFEVGSQINVHVRPKNPQAPGVDVTVNAKGLNPPSPCAPPSDRTSGAAAPPN